jgi:hypothetical protein
MGSYEMTDEQGLLLFVAIGLAIALVVVIVRMVG